VSSKVAEFVVFNLQGVRKSADVRSKFGERSRLAGGNSAVDQVYLDNGRCSTPVLPGPQAVRGQLALHTQLT